MRRPARARIRPRGRLWRRSRIRPRGWLRRRPVVRRRSGSGVRPRGTSAVAGRPAVPRWAAVARAVGSPRRRAIGRPGSRRRIGSGRARRHDGPGRRIRANRRSGAPRRRRPVHPVVLPAVPGPARVVAAPIVADAESHDADSQLRAEPQDGHAPALVVVIQKVAVDPAAVASQIHIAPTPVIQAAVDVQRRIGRYGENQRIVGARSGAQVRDALGVRDAGPSRGPGTHCHQDEERRRQTFHSSASNAAGPFRGKV